MHIIKNWLPHNQALIYGIFWGLACLCFALAPDLLPALLGHDGYVWTPVNSPLYRFGDSYYYSAWVAEGIQNGFPPGSPSAAEFAHTPLIETIRWFPLAVAALPSLVFSDFRTIYMLDYVFTVCLFFGIPYYLGYRFTKNALGSVLIGALVLFYGDNWSELLTRSRMLLNLSEYETLNSFRYINLSVSGPILMAYVALCHVLYAKTQPSRTIACIVLLLSPCMAFSYPSHALIAYLVIASYAGLAFLRGHQQSALILLLIGLFTATTLLLGGYIGYVQSTLADNELWNNIFNNENLTLIDRPFWILARLAFVNKYTVTVSIALWLVWKNRELRDMVLLLGGIGCVLVLTSLFNMPQLSGRFITRGINHLWMTSFAIACLWSWQDDVKPWLLSRTNRFTKFVEVAIFTLILTVPALGFGSYAITSAHNLTRFMPEGRWQALEWINTRVQKNDTVAALDWDDITFIPIYTSANLVVDNMIVGGRGPNDELERYVALWKILGFPREKLESRLTIMVETALHRINLQLYPKILSNPPLLKPEAYASSQIAEAILYWPYVKKVGEIDIEDKGQTAKSFISWAMKLYDDVNPAIAAKKYQISIILLSGAELSLPLKTQLPLERVFTNNTHQIYKVLK